MSEKIKITTLIEGTAIGHDLLAEHGVSFWIEYNGKNVLFDTGGLDAAMKFRDSFPKKCFMCSVGTEVEF